MSTWHLFWFKYKKMENGLGDKYYNNIYIPIFLNTITMESRDKTRKICSMWIEVSSVVEFWKDTAGPAEIV